MGHFYHQTASVTALQVFLYNLVIALSLGTTEVKENNKNPLKIYIIIFKIATHGDRLNIKTVI